MILGSLIDLLSTAEDHYDRQDRADTQWLTLGEGVTWVDVWWKVIADQQPNCAEQCKRMRYRPDVDARKCRPTDEQYAADSAGAYIKPFVSYTTVRRWIQANFRVRVKRLVVDQCTKCAVFLDKMRRAPSRTARDSARAQLRQHRSRADLSYEFRKQDHTRARRDELFGCVDMDFAGNFRCPLTSLGPAFYKRICPMFNYMFATTNHVSMYGWDERTAGKGPAAVLSCLRMWILHLKATSKPKLAHLVLWCDRCGGQAWNRYMLRFIHELVDPRSPLHIEGLLRVDVKAATTGHSFLWADRAIPLVKRLARNVPGGIVAPFKSAVAGLDEKYQQQTYQNCIEQCRMNDVPYHLHEVQQDEVLNFKSIFESTDCALVAHGRSIRYLHADGVSAGDEMQFKEDGLCWLSAGTTDDVTHHGEVWVRSAFDATSWKRIPLWRPKSGQGATWLCQCWFVLACIAATLVHAGLCVLPLSPLQIRWQ